MQVDLLLTLEEFCGEEGVFEGTGEQGSLFSAVFAKACFPQPSPILEPSSPNHPIFQRS